jgi:hypothetical protein
LGLRKKTFSAGFYFAHKETDLICKSAYKRPSQTSPAYLLRPPTEEINAVPVKPADVIINSL